MKNPDKPINPLLDLNEDKSGLWGLTKREYFAGLAMQALLSNPDPGIVNFNEKEIAEIAIEYTDELLKQLEK